MAKRIKTGKEYVVTETVAGLVFIQSELINNIPTLTKSFECIMPGTKLLTVQRIGDYMQCLINNDRFVMFDPDEFGHEIKPV
jgi:hypothetical protein